MNWVEWLRNPWVDRFIAAIAAIPFAWALIYNLGVGGLTIPQTAVILQLMLLLLTMLFRRPPVRVTPRPLYWIVAFVGSYYGFLTVSILTEGVALVPSLLTDGLSLLSIGLDGYARITLGRNIGFVPAERRLVMAGPYRVVRHPIYSALFLAEICVIMESFSWINLALSIVFLGLFVIKTLMEERFLAENPVYREYMSRVRHRWVPGLI